MSGATTDRIRAARAEAERAKKQLASTFVAAKEAMKPQTIASNAWDNVKDLGGGIATEVVDTVRGQPVTASAVGAALTVAIARRPLRWLSQKLSKSPDEAPLVSAPYATDVQQTTFINPEQNAPEALPASERRQYSEGMTA
ncbi:hypothetical protein [Allosphingosinicella vermicomposti]|uniref:hypothetical protein n=1 Tax=Allosphingosinicella vermicomposti TaxID=614671 RepID=UPI000D10B7BC|nr:hypothetical protein [Allosphingosinicella vermicomposti]